MKKKYESRITSYLCTRCNTPIDVESESFYCFAGVGDSNFWCSSCEDLPQAKIIGIPAQDLPESLTLSKGFIVRSVPTAEPVDVEDWNQLYYPYSKRSFLKQYSSWAGTRTNFTGCQLFSTVTVEAAFNTTTQQYSQELVSKIFDQCGGSACQFLRGSALKPETLHCELLRNLCNVTGPCGLCETPDEAMILSQYIAITGSDHFPMLIPQPSILMGKRRPDFILFVPITKFQYKKVAILVDRPGKDPAKIKLEDSEYQQEGFMVKRVLIDGTSYFKLSRELALWLQQTNFLP